MASPARARPEGTLPNAPSTRFESAPWEQLLRYTFRSKTGNCARIAKIELSLSAKNDSFSFTIHDHLCSERYHLTSDFKISAK